MQIDYVLLSDLECEAQRLATSIDNLTENLCGILHSVSEIYYLAVPTLLSFYAFRFRQ